MPNPRPNIQNLKPWQPGQSGNPKGRPPKARPITTILEQLLAGPANAMELELFQPRASYAETIVRNLLRIAAFESPRHALAAMSIVLDRIEGRAGERGEEREIDLADESSETGESSKEPRP
jgi:hypothetical protein